VRTETGRAVVLVVDDEEDVRELVREILRSAGFDTLGANGGDQAVVILQEDRDVDLVLTDVMMPDFDGPTLARRVARDWPGVPVLFMTGYPLDTLKALGMLPAGPSPIEKPFPIQELVRKVRQALKGD
jgi:CheY-like chemotaxis protein